VKVTDRTGNFFASDISLEMKSNPKTRDNEQNYTASNLRRNGR